MALTRSMVRRIKGKPLTILNLNDMTAADVIYCIVIFLHRTGGKQLSLGQVGLVSALAPMGERYRLGDQKCALNFVWCGCQGWSLILDNVYNSTRCLSQKQLDGSHINLQRADRKSPPEWRIWSVFNVNTLWLIGLILIATCTYHWPSL